MRDKVFLTSFLVIAGLLFYLGRHWVQESALLTEVLTFGASTSVGVLGLLLYRLQLQLKASRKELARKEAEISIAHEVQRALFPRQLPSGGGLNLPPFVFLPVGSVETFTMLSNCRTGARYSPSRTLAEKGFPLH